MEKTVSIKQKEAYLQGWQDAADALAALITKTKSV